MILRSLRIQNFRQIAGEYRLMFAPPGSRNVTIILGENGAGKSTLLNAFRWCLYGSIELENPEEVLSHYAAYKADVDDEVRVEVELHLEHDGINVTVQRAHTFRKIAGGETKPVGVSVVRVTKLTPNGATESVRDPEGFIANLLPPNLARFFFFQGESILQLALQRSREDLKEGVETFLDFRVLDRAVRHLSAVERDFEADLRRTGGEDVKDVQSQIDSIKDKLRSLDEGLAQSKRNEADIQTQIELLQRRLSEVEQFQPLLQEVDNAERLISEREAARREADRSLKSYISADGYFAFASAVLARPLALAAEAVEKGELPAKIKPQFVDDLLDRGECICGRPIDDAATATLQRWRTSTGVAAFEEAIASIRRGLTYAKTARADPLRTTLEERRTRLHTLTDEIRAAHEQRSSALRKIEGLHVSSAEIAELKRRFTTLTTEELVGAKVQERQLRDQIQDLTRQQQELEEKRNKLLKSKRAEQAIGARIDAAKSVRLALSEIRTNYSTFVQEYLDGRLKKSWSEVAQLPRRVCFTNSFNLTIEERGGSGEWVTSAPSEANCAVLALTFVAALIAFARELSRDPGRDNPFAGGDYPLVMDAPFAKMDVDFKEKVPAGLAKAVPQIVVITSLNQWRGEVEMCLNDAVGRAYSLVLHRPGDGTSTRTVEAFNRQVPYVLTDEAGPTDWTEIVEVL